MLMIWPSRRRAYLRPPSPSLRGIKRQAGARAGPGRGSAPEPEPNVWPLLGTQALRNMAN